GVVETDSSENQMEFNNRILFIDDTPAIHSDYRKILEAPEKQDSDPADLFLGIQAQTAVESITYDLVSAYQGREGVELARQACEEGRPMAVAFVDMRMPPGWDGLKTIQELWKVDPQLQIVICTAYSDHSWQDLQLELGRTDNLLILKKPFDSAEVNQLVVALTEKWRLQRELETALDGALAANEAKTRFVATMSHELRTPLNGILGMTRLLEATELTSRQRSYLSACRTSGESLLNVIGDILDFSKIEAGQSGLSVEETNLFDLVEGVIQSVGSSLAKNKPEVDLTGFVDPRIPVQMIADAGKLQQLMFNLVGNSVKFTEEGSISVSAHAKSVTGKSATVEFFVRDTGIGISAEEREAIFQPFSQADSSNTRKYEGTGLGLNICLEFVKLMGGERIDVDSTVGAGTEFSFVLDFELPEGAETREPPQDLETPLIVGALGLSSALAGNFGELLRAVGGDLRVLDVDSTCDLTNFSAVVIDFHDNADHLRLFHDKIRNCRGGSDIRIVPVVTAGSELNDEQTDGLKLENALSKPVCQSRFFHALRLKSLASGHAEKRYSYTDSIPLAREYGLDRPIRLLVVEDNAINRMFAEDLFETANFYFKSCVNGREAIDAIAENDDYDLILMDCQMPVMDGFEASTTIKKWSADGRIKDIPIVAWTANAISTTREKCMNSGMVDYLSKPFEIEDLFGVIDRCLGKFAGSPSSN
ncbi:MAG: response regulator, partial [Planctomycetota bacterium]